MKATEQRQHGIQLLAILAASTVMRPICRVLSRCGAITSTSRTQSAALARANGTRYFIPVRAAREFVRDDESVVQELTAQGMEPALARSFAGIASLGSDPRKTACALVQKFRHVENLVKRTHPHVAQKRRTRGLSRDPIPIATARDDVANYDRILETFERVDPRRARNVANQSFRTHDPMAGATRFHRQLASANG